MRDHIISFIEKHRALIHVCDAVHHVFSLFFNLIALRKVKIVCNFGLSECNRVKEGQFC